jgi:hypothetical protein
MAPAAREALTAAAAVAAVVVLAAQARCSATWRIHSDSWRHDGRQRYENGSSSESYTRFVSKGSWEEEEEEEEDAAAPVRWRLAWRANSWFASISDDE